MTPIAQKRGQHVQNGDNMTAGLICNFTVLDVAQIRVAQTKQTYYFEVLAKPRATEGQTGSQPDGSPRRRGKRRIHHTANTAQALQALHKHC